MKNYSDQIIDPTNLDQKLAEIKDEMGKYVIKSCLLVFAANLTVLVLMYLSLVALDKIPPVHF